MKDKTVLITGGSRGLGLSCARAFLEKGARVVIAGRSRERLKEAVAKLGECPDLKTFSVDVTDEGRVLELVNFTTEQFGSVDILINNAGGGSVGSVLETDLKMWNDTLAVNATGTFLMCRAVLPSMLKRGRGGRIINISSVAGARGSALASAYSAAKGAVNAFSKALAVEAASSGITVNCILPGFMDTGEFHRPAEEYAKKRMGIDRETLWRTNLQQVPIGRMLDPAEVAELAVFLASNGAGGITGQCYVISGGLYIS